MAKKKCGPTVQSPGSMLEQKTFEDFNRKVPEPEDPNESKGKTQPQKPNLADKAKNPMKEKTKKETLHLPSTKRKRSKRIK